MIKSEFIRAIKSNRTKIMLVFLLVLVSYDLFANWKMIFFDYYQHPASYEGIKPFGKYVMQPCFASFLSASSLGHFAQIIFVWILPVYVLFMYSDNFIAEKHLGYYDVLITKNSRMAVIKSKLITSFLLPFLLLVFVLSINFIMAIIVFKGGTSFMGMEQYYKTFHGIMYLSMLHPYYAYLIYILVFSCITGLCGVLCTGICMIVPNYLLAYPIAVLIWFGLSNLPWSIMSLTQCYAGYYNNEIYGAAGIYAVLVAAVTIGSVIYKVKSDEL